MVEAAYNQLIGDPSGCHNGDGNTISDPCATAPDRVSKSAKALDGLTLSGISSSSTRSGRTWPSAMPSWPPP